MFTLTPMREGNFVTPRDDVVANQTLKAGGDNEPTNESS